MLRWHETVQVVEEILLDSDGSFKQRLYSDQGFVDVPCVSSNSPVPERCSAMCPFSSFVAKEDKFGTEVFKLSLFCRVNVAQIISKKGEHDE